MPIDQTIYSYITKEETYQEGEVILQEETTDRHTYVILDGNVKLRKRTSQGHVALGTLKKGAFLGEMHFLAPDDQGRSVSAVAVNGHARLGILDVDRLAGDYASVSPRLKELIQSLVRKIRTANDTICNIVITAK